MIRSAKEARESRSGNGAAFCCPERREKDDEDDGNAEG